MLTRQMTGLGWFMKLIKSDLVSLSPFSSPGIDHIAAKLSNQLWPSQTHKLSDDTI